MVRSFRCGGGVPRCRGAIKSEFLIGSFLTPSGRPFLAYYVPSEYADVAERLVQAYDDCELSSVPPSDRLLEAVVTLVRGTFAYEPVEESVPHPIVIIGRAA